MRDANSQKPQLPHSCNAGVGVGMEVSKVPSHSNYPGQLSVASDGCRKEYVVFYP
jgi:hypothetical protein